MLADSRRTDESWLSTESQDCSGKPHHRIASQLPVDDAGKTAMPDRRKGNKQAITTRLNPATIARLKQTAKDAAGKPLYATVSGIIEAGILAECDRIEAILDATLTGVPVPVERQHITTKRNTTNAQCGPLKR